MTLRKDEYGSVDIKKYILQFLKSKSEITNIVWNNIFYVL